jgi:serine/threonine-protein kinase
MRADEEAVFAAAEAVADERPVDWALLEPTLGLRDRALLDQLRVIAGVARVHRQPSTASPDNGLTASSEGNSDLSWRGLQSELLSLTESAFRQELQVIAGMAALHRNLAGPATAPTGAASGVGPAASGEQPARWGHLELREKIGEGGFGAVHKAYDPHLAREVAVKLVKHSAGVLGPRSAELMREGRLLARLRHPNVVTVYGADFVDGTLGIWMECIDGRSLADIVAAIGPYGAREALLVGIDIVRALAAVHAAGLIHGDIKAQNVMRESGGRTVLMDFGAGRDVKPASDDLAVALVGTPLYMAPELFDGKQGSIQSDIYSVGVLLDYLASGTFPIDGRTLSDVRAAHKAGRRRMLRDARPDLPVAFIRVVERAMAERPEDRYASAGAMESALTGALTECDALAAASAVRPPQAETARAARQGTAAAVLDVVRSRRARIAAAVLLLLLSATYLWSRRAAPALSVASIGVLPLQNESGTADYDYFAEGVTDLLTNNLAKIRGLRVASRSSAAQFKGDLSPLADIARRLKVDALIDGSVRRDRDHVRATVRLTAAATGLPVWTQTYDEDARNVLAMQVQVVKDVARAIGITLTPEAERALGQTRQVRVDAQDAYLRGRYYQNRLSRDGAQGSVAYFDEAIRLDPGYAPPYAALAASYILLNTYGVVSTEETVGRARAAVQRALEIDDQVAEVHVVLGDIQFLHDWNWAPAEKSYQRAIELNPSYAYAYAEYSWFLAARGRLDEALQAMYRAEELDPLSLMMKSNVAGVLYYAHQWDAAIDKCQEILRVDPSFGMAHRRLMQLYAEKNMLEESLQAGARALQITGPDPGPYADFARVQAMAGNRSAAERMAGDLSHGPEKIGRLVTADRLAFVHAALGNRDKAFELLQQALDQRAANIPWLTVDPHYDSLRDDPRFPRLLQQLDMQSGAK